MLLTKDRLTFLDSCRKILKKLGAEGLSIACGNESTGLTYEDELIYISEFSDGSFMEVERKRNKTPIIYIHDGAIILYSGDFYFLEDHVKYLLTLDE